jgi:topoisomerase-4 subunit A
MHIAVWRKGDTRTVYHMAYQDGTKGPFYAKRFNVTSIIRDKEYNLTRGTPNSRVFYFSVQPNGESETVTINLRQRPNLRKPTFDFEFSQMGVKGMSVMGNIISKFLINKIVQKSVGKAKPVEREVYYDTLTGRINSEGRGEMIGMMLDDEMILAIMHDGTYRLLKSNADVRLETEPVLIEKFNSRKPITAVYYEAKKDAYFVKRFLIENPGEKIVKFIPEGKDNRIEIVSTRAVVRIGMQFDKRSTDSKDEKVNLSEFVEVRNEKAVGNKLTDFKIKTINIMPPLPSDHVLDKQYEPVGNNEEDMFEEEDPITEFIKKKREDEVKGKPKSVDEDGQTKLF